jgi:hypothetical protein
MMKAYGSLHCLQEQEAEYSAESSSDGEQSAPLNGSHTQLAYLPPDKMTAFSRLSRYGMTFKPLTESRGGELLTLYLAGFLAKTYQQQEKAQGSRGNGQVCGSTWQESLVMFDRVSCSWKIHRSLFDEGLCQSLVTLPRWGMMQNGVVYQRLNVERYTSATGFGFLLPTPTCHNAKEGNYPAEQNRRTPLLATHVGGKIHPHFTEWMMAWPEGWTDLKPLATDKFQSAWLKHFDYLENSDETKPNYDKQQD